jgi:hypothetical protein
MSSTHEIIDMTTLSFRYLLGLVTVAVMAVTGCSGQGVKKMTVHGTVSYKGEPLHSGHLKFIGPGDASAGAVIHSDGTFTMTDVVPGEVKVCVVDTPLSSGGPTVDGKKAPSEPKTPPLSLPEKYRDPEKSGLQYTITPDTKELAIDIK